jgi:hypothetical protein
MVGAHKNERTQKDTTALKLQFMLTAMQFLFFNKVTVMPPKSSFYTTTKSSTAQNNEKLQTHWNSHHQRS